jgi:hypothetical protein
MAVTVAALPVLVIDNISATAEPSAEAPVEATAASVEASSSSAPSTTVTTAVSVTAPPTTAAPTTETTVAPPTTEAPAPEVVVSQTLTTAAPPAPPTTEAPPPPPPSVAPTPYGDPSDPATWDRMAQCESGGNWAMNSGNGYYGGLQFSLATWRNVGGTGYPHQASRAEQIKRGQILQARAGWGQWPHCARQLGYL